MKYSKILISALPTITFAQLNRIQPGAGYIDDSQTSDNNDYNSQYEYIDTSNQYLSPPPNEITSILSNSEDIASDYYYSGNANNEDLPSQDLHGDEAIGVLSAIKIAAEQELMDLEDELNDDEVPKYGNEQTQKSKWEIAVNELSKIMDVSVNEIKVNLTAPLADRIASNSVRSGGCRTARKKKKQRNGGGPGCEAVLPLDLNYGCWCHADSNDAFKGRGQHVDEFDKACKMYKQCMRCVRHDARTNGEVCDPANQPFLTQNQRHKDGIHQECSSNNQGNCAVNTCCCEVEYVRTILDLFVIKGVQLTRGYYHNKFNYDNKCQGAGNGGHQVECCGEFPNRRMYNTFSRQCCQNKSVFDPTQQVCCDDGLPASSVAECDNPNRAKKRRRRNARSLFA